MIKIVLNITLLFFSLSLLAQTETTKLPNFYSQEEGNSVMSADFINLEFPTVLYTDQLYGKVYCKQWKEGKWVGFGEIPDVTGSGTVKLNSYGDMLYALVWEKEGWSIFTKKGEDLNWTVLGDKYFASSETFTSPTLNFNDGNIMIYEKNLTTNKLVLYTHQKGKIAKVKSKFDKEIEHDFHYTSTDKKESVMAWESKSTDKKTIVKVGSVKGKTKSVKFSKGLPKDKIWSIEHLTFYNGKLYLAYFDYAFNLRLAYYDEGEEKWTTIYPPKNPDDHRAYFSKEMSFVVINRKTKKPVLHQFTGDNWLEGTVLDVGQPINESRTIKLIENKESLYLMYFNTEKGCQIHQIKK